MLKGRRYGNIIVAGGDTPLDASAPLRRRLLGGGVPAQFWDDAQARAWIGNSRSRHDPT